MRNATTKGGLLVGALATAGLGLWLLSSGPSEPAHRAAASTKTTRHSGSGATTTARAPRAADSGNGAATEPTAATPPASTTVDRQAVARDLIRRLKEIGTDFKVPDDLRGDLLAFMTGSPEDRDLLFRMAWNPATPARVNGNLGLFLRMLEDPALRESLLAAFNEHDPENAARVAMAERARDTQLLAAELRATPSGKARFDLVANLPEEACTDPDVGAFLKDAADRDPDVETRAAAFNRLACANVEGTRKILLDAVGDPGRTLRERQAAAHSILALKDKPDAEELVRLYEEAPDDVRPLLLANFGQAGPSRRIDDILLENAVAVGDRRLRSNSTLAIGYRIVKLPKPDARDLGERTAALVRSAGPETSAEMLKYLGLAAMQDGPVRDAVRDLGRSAPTGGAIQVAISGNPALRSAAGL